MKMSGIPLLLLIFLTAADRPVPKFPVSKETTYVTGPLDKEGYIDYEAALNDRLGKGITPENNANVLLWKALGPRPEGGAGMPAEFFKLLGIEEPPQRGEYFIDLEAYVKDHLKLDQDQFNTIYEQLDRSRQRVWTAKDYPHVAGWLKANEKPLALVVEAATRPRYFHPHVSQKTADGPGGLFGRPLIPDTLKCKEFAKALAARAMLRAGEGKFDEGWQDLLACHRLARLVGSAGLLIDALVGIYIESVTTHGDLSYLSCGGLSAQQIRADRKELHRLPPPPLLADTIDLGERLFYLDCVQFFRRGGLRSLENLEGNWLPTKPTPKEKQALAAIDWEPALRTANRWYDRNVTAMRIKDRAGREKEFGRIEQEMKAVKKGLGSETALRKTFPSFRSMQNAVDRQEQWHRNLDLAFALAIYLRDHGRYPAKLEELAPKYLSAIPADLFSGKALIYRPSETGYLLYSVGVNGLDDAGHTFEDDPRGDDLPVRMPLPELKQWK